MITSIDHIVILAPQLEAAVRHYQRLGFEVRAGGRHSTGTENALIGLEDGSYIELLAFATPDPTHRWAPKLAHGGGFLDVCLASDDLSSDLLRYAAAGIEMLPMREMSRVRPDGTELVWRLSIPKAPWAGQMPFLIEDVSPSALRLPPAGVHSNAVSGIAAMRWIVADWKGMAEGLMHVLGHPGEPFANDTYKAAGALFRLGSTRIEIASPSGKGLAADWLAVHGDGPHSLAFYTATGIEVEHAPRGPDRWADWTG